MGGPARIRRAWWGIRQEFAWGWRHVRVGRREYLTNVVAYRVLKITSKVPGINQVHRLETDRGVVLYYRRNRGDVQGIREIFIDEIYRLPEGASPESLVDLGANIGLASVWLAHEYSIGSVLALEPLSQNFDLLERNLRANKVAGQLRRAAVGPVTGSTNFDLGRESNMGRVGEGELVVEVCGVSELISSMTFAGSLLKIDVEGMEEQLLRDVDPAWIRNFQLVVMEMHPEYFEIGPLITTICDQGFNYFEPVEVSLGIHRSKRERLFVRSDSSLTR